MEMKIYLTGMLVSIRINTGWGVFHECARYRRWGVQNNGVEFNSIIYMYDVGEEGAT
jgi:hypothetical protein